MEKYRDLKDSVPEAYDWWLKNEERKKKEARKDRESEPLEPTSLSVDKKETYPFKPFLVG